MNPNIGKLVIGAGVVLILAGLVIYFAGDKLNWFGRLPGDIRVERENFRFYFPVTSLILVSLLLNLLIFFVRRFWN